MQFEMGNLHGKLRLIGRIKMDCENIFNTKKKDTCLVPFQSLFRVCHICHFDLLSLIYLEVRSGLEAF